MKRKRFSEEQIISILREHEAGSKVKDLIRRHGIAEQTFYRWKNKYGGMDVSDARLKKLLADQMLDNAALKELLSKEW